MKCRFVIDVRNGFVSPKTDEVLPRIEKLMGDFRGGPIIATRFVNRGGPSIRSCIGSGSRLVRRRT